MPKLVFEIVQIGFLLKSKLLFIDNFFIVIKNDISIICTSRGDYSSEKVLLLLILFLVFIIVLYYNDFNKSSYDLLL